MAHLPPPSALRVCKDATRVAGFDRAARPIPRPSAAKCMRSENTSAVKLFRWLTRQVQLTHRGGPVSRAVRDALERFRLAAEQIVRDRRGRPLPPTLCIIRPERPLPGGRHARCDLRSSAPRRPSRRLL